MMPKSGSVDFPKPKLVSVSVPWRVCYSTSFLRLTVGEDRGDCPTEVSFVGFDLTTEYIQVHAPWEIDPSIQPTDEEMITFANDHPDPRDKVVKVTFNLSSCARMVPDYLEIEPSNFDLSKIPFRDDLYINELDWEGNYMESCRLAEAINKENLRLEKESWLKTGICPDPNMYEVQGSPWLQELQSKGLYLGREDLVFKHYLIAGHSRHVDVIASGWSWQYLN
jgi:hypothetical protein